MKISWPILLRGSRLFSTSELGGVKKMIILSTLKHELKNHHWVTTPPCANFLTLISVYYRHQLFASMDDDAA